MAIPKSEKNKKLDAAPEGQPMAAVTALKKLEHKAKYSMVYSRDGNPELPRGGVKYHLQGVSVYVGAGNRRNRVIITTSAEKGNIIMGVATVDGRNYTVQEKPVGYKTKEKVHPGGIQVIGRYVAIPIYFKGKKGIEIRDIEDGLKVVKESSVKGTRPYCVGITTVGESSNEYYVLAVVTKSDGSRVEIYTTEPGQRLKEPDCKFKYSGSFWPELHHDTPWNYYSNNISLMSDNGGNIYFLGLYNTDRDFGNGVDIVDLYQLQIAKPATVKFRRLSEFVADRKNGSFRFGVGATVLDPATIQIHACERNGQVEMHSRKDVIDCDLYNVG